MDISWVIDPETKVCYWNFILSEATFRVGMPLDKFFFLVRQLYHAIEQIQGEFEDGLDSQAAIAEFERIINKAASIFTVKLEEAGMVVALRFSTMDGSEEQWELVKKEVVDRLKAQDNGQKYDKVMVIEMPCGNKLEFATYDEIMALEQKNVPCPCGKPNHWLIHCDQEGSRGPAEEKGGQ